MRKFIRKYCLLDLSRNLINYICLRNIVHLKVGGREGNVWENITSASSVERRISITNGPDRYRHVPLVSLSRHYTMPLCNLYVPWLPSSSHSLSLSLCCTYCSWSIVYTSICTLAASLMVWLPCVISCGFISMHANTNVLLETEWLDSNIPDM